MWVRTIKITFANELMKNSVRSYMSDTVDLTEGMLLVYRVDLAANVSLVNHFFPDKESLDSFSEKLKPVREQLKSMGAKVEINDGPVWGSRSRAISHWTCCRTDVERPGPGPNRPEPSPPACSIADGAAVLARVRTGNQHARIPIDENGL